MAEDAEDTAFVVEVIVEQFRAVQEAHLSTILARPRVCELRANGSAEQYAR
jgi:hypothetical protein